MVLSSAKDLGRTIASQQKQIDELKQNVKPNDPNASFPLFSREVIRVGMTVIGIKKIYALDSFIVNHPTLGDVDSSTLKIDGGYTEGIPNEIFPLTFPISFSVTGTGETIINKTF